jgi:hypothetical protein
LRKRFLAFYKHNPALQGRESKKNIGALAIMLIKMLIIGNLWLAIMAKANLIILCPKLKFRVKI